MGFFWNLHTIHTFQIAQYHKSQISDINSFEYKMGNLFFSAYTQNFLPTVDWIILKFDNLQ